MSEEQAQQFMQQLQMLEQYATDLSQRESALVNMLRDAHSTVDAVRALGEKQDSESLIPIGMGVFIKTKVSSKEKIVLNIGAGVTLEKDRDYALTFLESKIKEIEVALQDTSAKRQETMNKLEQGKQEMNKLLQSGNPQASQQMKEP